MALLKIFSLSGVEIEYKKDSLTLKKENNSLSSDFKVPHSSFPFLVIENDITKKELGPSDITSIKKNKIIPVVILENGVRYYGELQQLTVLSKFRKCNLKYGSDLIAIINKKIAEYMPVISVIPGETAPIPFTEKNPEIIAGYNHWQNFANNMVGKIYPDEKFQLPMMYWKNKYGIGLEPTDPNYFYQNNINNFTLNESGVLNFLENFFSVSISEATAINKNIVSPQVFLLSPLHYIFTAIGWKIYGSFVTNDLIKKTLLLSTKNNMTKVILFATKTDVNFSWSWSNAYLYALLPTYRTTATFSALPTGTYVCSYYFKIPPQTATFFNPIGTSLRLRIKRTPFSISLSEEIIIYNAPYNATELVFEGEVEFETGVSFEELSFDFYSKNQQQILDYRLFFRKKDSEKEYQEMHPTIELGRYVPEWSVGNYLNYIKNMFNLDITINDFKKEITLNLNEDTTNDQAAVISQSLKMQSYDIAANSSFIIRYQNDEDESLYISHDQTIPFNGVKDDFTKILDSKFKYVPFNGYTSELSEALQEKDGVGLVIYDPVNAPYTSQSTIDGFNYKIIGEKGIYETFFKRWIKFLLNASNCEMTGYFTETEIAKINNLKSVYINNQRFRIIEIETTEASNNFQEVKMKLLSVNY